MSRELILQESIEELTPKLIAFNNEELKAIALEDVQKYKGIMYSDEQMKEAKEDRAKFKKVIDTLNNERLRIKKIYNAPLDKFTAQINEVIEIYENGRVEIDKQIKANEEATKKQKENILREYFREQIAEKGLATILTYEKIADPRWLNSTVSEKKAKAEIDEKISKIECDIGSIETLQSPDESMLKTIYFRTLNLAQTIMENEKLKAERAKIAEMDAKSDGSIGIEKSNNEDQVNHSLPEADEPKEERILSLILEVSGTESEMKGLLNYIKTNGISVKATKKN